MSHVIPDYFFSHPRSFLTEMDLMALITTSVAATALILIVVYSEDGGGMLVS